MSTPSAETIAAALMLVRVWSKVDRRSESECWPWSAHRNASGYGRMRVGGGLHLAHRLAWLASTGEIPDGAVVIHRCDNPPCCNPAHLRVGSVQDNNLDRDSKGRAARGEKIGAPLRRYISSHEGCRAGSSNGHASVSERDVAEIRKAYAAGEMNQPQLARQYGVTQTTISSIVRRETWRHVA